jgi:putative oxidoreductase
MDVLLRRTGRLLLCGIFIHGGWNAFSEPGRRRQQAEKLRLPEPELAVKVNGLTMVGAGAALGLGAAPHLAALVLAGSLVPTTLAGHRFWEQEDERGRAMQLTHFLKNLGLMGGLLYVVAEER